MWRLSKVLRDTLQDIIDAQSVHTQDNKNQEKLKTKTKKVTETIYIHPYIYKEYIKKTKKSYVMHNGRTVETISAQLEGILILQLEAATQPRGS